MSEQANKTLPSDVLATITGLVKIAALAKQTIADMANAHSLTFDEAVALTNQREEVFETKVEERILELEGKPAGHQPE